MFLNVFGVAGEKGQKFVWKVSLPVAIPQSYLGFGSVFGPPSRDPRIQDFHDRNSARFSGKLNQLSSESVVFHHDVSAIFFVECDSHSPLECAIRSVSWRFDGFWNSYPLWILQLDPRSTDSKGIYKWCDSLLRLRGCCLLPTIFRKLGIRIRS